MWGLERGYCMMIGGETEAIRHLDPIFATLAPGMGKHRPHTGPRQNRRHSRTGLPALRARTAPAISSKWFTTESSTA